MNCLRHGLLLATLLSLTACATFPDSNRSAPVSRAPQGAASRTPQSVTPPAVDGPAPSWQKDYAPTADEIPANVADTPDAVPVAEPRSSSGNAETYEVLGKTYHVMDDATGFRQRGYASWYGKKFHGRLTASGERYDMFAMTAAHKTLPLPSYVKVTNLTNGKTAVVKVNDRGPFHSSRIIDLSYAAAAKIGLIGHGTTMVEIAVLNPDTYAPEPSAPAAAEAAKEAPPLETASVSAIPVPALGPDSGFLQIGAFMDPINAATLRDNLQSQGFTPVVIHISSKSDIPIHRVLVGPFRDADSARATRDQLTSRNLLAQWVKD